MGARRLFHETVREDSYEVTRVELVRNAHLARATSGYFASEVAKRQRNVFWLELPEDLASDEKQAKTELVSRCDASFKRPPWVELCSEAAHATHGGFVPNKCRANQMANDALGNTVRVLPVW